MPYKAGLFIYMKKKKDAYKFNSKKKEQWLEVYKKSGSVTRASNAVNISRPTVYGAIKNDIKFREKKEDFDNLIDDTVEKNLFDLTKKNIIAAIFWLCNRRKDTWKNVQKTEHSGENGEPIRFIIADAKRKCKKS